MVSFIEFLKYKKNIKEEDGGVPVNNVAATPGVELFPTIQTKKILRRKKVKKNVGK